MDWQFADARNRFSELVNHALADGPQRIRRRADTVVVVAQRDYERLTGERTGFKQFLLGKDPSLKGWTLGVIARGCGMSILQIARTTEKSLPPGKPPAPVRRPWCRARIPTS